MSYARGVGCCAISAMASVHPVLAHCPDSDIELITVEEVRQGREFDDTQIMGKTAVAAGKVTTKAIIVQSPDILIRSRSFDRFTEMVDILVDAYEGDMVLVETVAEKFGQRIDACEGHLVQ